MSKNENKKKRNPKIPVMWVIIAIIIGVNAYSCFDDGRTYMMANKEAVATVTEEKGELSASEETEEQKESEITEAVPADEKEIKQIRVVVSQTKPAVYIAKSILHYSLRTALYILLAVAIKFGIAMMGGLSGGISVVSSDEIEVMFSDVIGLDEIKDELQFLVSMIKKKPEDLNIKIPHGILLEGPPGNGKTMLAKALAHESGCNFIEVEASDIINPYVGVASKKIDSIFDKAIENAPCIIFFDEIDAVGSKRVSDPTGSVDKEENATLTTLLSRMDGFYELDGILVIAATNMAGALDPALVRPGRFDKHFTIGNPDFSQREDLFKHFSEKHSIGTGFDITKFSRRTYGFNCAQIQNVINEACLIAFKDNRKTPEERDIDKAIMQMQLNGYERTKYRLSEQDRRIAAYHEAGHAVVGFLTDGQNISRISIKPTTSGAGGYTMLEYADETELKPLRSIKNRITVLYGGRAAEAHLFGSVENASNGASQDIKNATEIAAAYISANEGIDYSIFGQSGVDTIMEHSQKVLKEAWAEAQEMVNNHWNALEIVAEELMKCETVSADRFNEIMKMCA